MTDVYEVSDEELFKNLKCDDINKKTIHSNKRKRLNFLKNIEEDIHGYKTKLLLKIVRIIHKFGWDIYEAQEYDNLFTIGDKPPIVKKTSGATIFGGIHGDEKEDLYIDFVLGFGKDRENQIPVKGLSDLPDYVDKGKHKTDKNYKKILNINNDDDLKKLKEILHENKNLIAEGRTARWPCDYRIKAGKMRPELSPNSSSRKGEATVSKPQPLNQIFYGPPGTGKTYATARAAVEICDGSISSEERKEIMERYYELAGDGRIEFITFHQSIAYEDFIEGLRPTSLEDGKLGFELKSQSGVFRRIVTAALGESEDTLDEDEGTFSLGDSRVFKVSLGEYKDEAPDQNLFKDAINDGYIIIGYNAGSLEDPKFKSRQEILKSVLEAGVVEAEKVTTSSGWVSIPNIFRNQMRVGDFVIVSAGNGKFRAVGQITGEYYYEPIEGNPKYAHRRRVKWLWSTSNPTEDHDVTKIYKNKFSQATVYELKNNLIDKEYLNKVIEGISLNNPEINKKNYVLIIDEINRANISKVFGELITLLEDDKRLGKINALEVTLPYSGNKFGVPDNLYIIGTMNTADRSIALLDTALRRRFEFKELMPDPEKLKEVELEDAEGIDLRGFLKTLNNRIEYLLDREHQIGHAFFINCKSKADLDAVMRNKVIPLLAEYFYDDWASMAVVLGDAELLENKGGKGKFLQCEKLIPPPGCETEGNEDRYRWSILPDEFKAEVYQNFLKNTENTLEKDEPDEQAGP